MFSLFGVYSLFGFSGGGCGYEQPYWFPEEAIEEEMKEVEKETRENFRRRRVPIKIKGWRTVDGNPTFLI